MKKQTEPSPLALRLLKNFWEYVLLIFTVLMLLTACEDTCEVEQRYTYYEPVYTSLEELRSSVTTLPAEPLRTHGKIFFKDGFLFINEPNKGIHIIDNRNPVAPVNMAFINIPGSFDLVIRGNLLYTDSYMDLVIIDITDKINAIEVNRINNVFSSYNSYGFYVSEELGVVTNWVEREQVNISNSECGEQQIFDWGMYYRGGIAFANFESFDTNLAVAPNNPGMAGSMSRFALTKEHLYLLDLDGILPAKLDVPMEPVINEKVHLDWGIETLFPAKDHLFVGAQNGMHILNLDDPFNPSLLSTYSHVNSCDPVVVDGDYAYVTLRSGNECAGFTNQLEVININDLTNPQLEYIYPMENPHGLGKDGNLLFICDGAAGLKVYNTSDLSKLDINLQAHYKDIDAYDIIPYQNIAMMIGEDGLYQYDYSDLNNIRLMSHIKIGQQ